MTRFTNLTAEMFTATALLLALLCDALLGEPPSRLHPVVGMGRYLTWMKRRNSSRKGTVSPLNKGGLRGALLLLWYLGVSHRSKSPQPPLLRGAFIAFWQGTAYLVLGCLLVVGLAWLFVYLLSFLPIWLKIPLLALLLKPLFSFRALLKAGDEVKQSLQRGDLPEARRFLSWHLVSRDTHELTESEVAGAAVESLAENLTDSVIAPLFYFALLGLPGAALYRFVNTADAVLGYRTEELESFGKAAARLDDLLNFIPARFAAALLYFALGLSRHRPVRGLTTALTANLPSPNAGWTMGMVAGGLDVQLDKRGVYVLNAGGTPPKVEDISKTQRLLIGATALGTLSFIGLAYA